MTAFGDDLAPLISKALHGQPGTQTPPRYTVGVLRQWNPTTFQNTVEWQGAELHDLAVLNGIEALSFTEGINVALLGMSGTGALVSFAILGRYIDPGSDASTKAIQSLQSEIARQISAEIFAERIFTSFDGALGTRNNVGYGNLSGASVGPTLTDVPISAVGKAVVIAGCFINCSLTPGFNGFMSVQISGATTRPANDGWAYSVGTTGVGGDKALGSAAAVSVQEGLNAGLHDFTAEYRTLTAGGNISFSARNLVVIAF